jgi:Protein of unknown function (DUF2786)
MSKDIRERVRQLIELATHPTANEGESRNAALAACRLIKDHRLLDTAAVSPSQRYTVGIDSSSLEDFFAAAIRQQREQQRRQGWHAVSRRPSVRVEGDAPNVKFPPDPNARELLTSDVAWCGACNERIQPPRLVMWSRNEVFHKECYADAIKQRQ